VPAATKYPPGKVALDLAVPVTGLLLSEPRGSFSVAVWCLRSLLTVVAASPSHRAGTGGAVLLANHWRQVRTHFFHAVADPASPLPCHCPACHAAPEATTALAPSPTSGVDGKALRRLLSPPLLSAVIALASSADSSDRRVAVLYVLVHSTLPLSHAGNGGVVPHWAFDPGPPCSVSVFCATGFLCVCVFRRWCRYLLSEVLRWAPSSSLTPSVRDQLTAFKRNLEELFESQTRAHPGSTAGFGVPLDGPPPATQAPMAFSSELQATLAVFTSLALHQHQKRHHHRGGEARPLPQRCRRWVLASTCPTTPSLHYPCAPTPVPVLCPRAAGRASDAGAHVPTAPWFNRVVEVSGIVDALVHRDRALPDSFLFAEDTFLRRVALAETVVVETAHPCGPTDKLSAEGRGCVCGSMHIAHTSYPRHIGVRCGGAPAAVNTDHRACNVGVRYPPAPAPHPRLHHGERSLRHQADSEV
jgi:hypothetical protein